jgi:hypothetical protein
LFNVIRNEISDRILGANTFWNESIQSTGSIPRSSPFSKGIIFVHLYAIYEYAVVNSFKSAISAIKLAADGCCDLKREPLAILLHPEWSSIIQSGRNSTWEKRISVLKKIGSTDIPTLDDTVFPTDGSHFRQGQLITIWKILDISTPIIPENRLLGRIDELVENRNAIAHGRKKPEEIGRIFAENEIKDRIVDTERISLHVVDTLDNYITNKNYLV